MKKARIAALVWLIVGVSPVVVAVSPLPATAAEPSPVTPPESSPSSAAGDQDGRLSVTLPRIVREVARRNGSIVGEYLQSRISKAQVAAEKGIFEPVLETSYTGQDIRKPNDTYDELISLQPEYTEKSLALDAGVTALTPTGAQVNLKFDGGKKHTSIIEKYRDYRYEYNDTLKLSVEQPLLRGAGFDATRVKINLAKVQSEIDESKFEQRLMELVGTTIQVYWRLYGAQRIARTWQTSLDIAREAVKDVELRASNGKIAMTEVLEAQSGVSLRRAELMNAKSKVVEARNQLMTLLNVSVSDNEAVDLVPSDDPFGDHEAILDVDDYVKTALQQWPEYRILTKTVEKEKIQAKNAWNQLLPKFDFVGSVSTASLASDRNAALKDVGTDRFVSWSVGVRLTVPLLGNTQARSGYSIAKMRVQQAENEMYSFVQSLNNSISSKVQELKSVQEQLAEYEKGMKAKEELLEIEREKLKMGRTNLKNLFAKEEDFVYFQRRVYSAVINCKMAEATLQIAMGNILAKYEVDKRMVALRSAAVSKDLTEILGGDGPAPAGEAQ